MMNPIEELIADIALRLVQIGNVVALLFRLVCIVFASQIEIHEITLLICEPILDNCKTDKRCVLFWGSLQYCRYVLYYFFAEQGSAQSCSCTETII